MPKVVDLDTIIDTVKTRLPHLAEIANENKELADLFDLTKCDYTAPVIRQAFEETLAKVRGGKNVRFHVVSKDEVPEDIGENFAVVIDCETYDFDVWMDLESLNGKDVEFKYRDQEVNNNEVFLTN